MKVATGLFQIVMAGVLALTLAASAQEGSNYAQMMRNAVTNAQAQPGATADSVAAAATQVMDTMVAALAGDGDLSAADLSQIAAAVEAAVDASNSDFEPTVARALANTALSVPAVQVLPPAEIRSLAIAVGRGAIIGASAGQAVAVGESLAEGAMMGARNQGQAINIASGIATGAAEGANQAHPGLRTEIDAGVTSGLNTGAGNNPNIAAPPAISRVAEAAQGVLAPPQS